MKWTQRVGVVLGAGALVAATTIAPANAWTFNTSAPQTPENTESLPIVNVYQKSDHLKPNVLNARPVCNAWEDYRTVAYQTSDSFSPVGTISTTNKTSKDIPLTQSLSKTQTVTLTVNGSQSQEFSFNTGGTGNLDKGSINAGAAMSISKTVGGSGSYSLSWSTGQEIGPYNVPAGYTGEATYGFRTVSITGTQQFCKLDGTWSNPVAWRAIVPIKNEVQVKLYNNVADSYIEKKYDENGKEITND